MGDRYTPKGITATEGGGGSPGFKWGPPTSGDVGGIPLMVQNGSSPAMSSVYELAMDQMKGPLEPGSLLRIFSLKKEIPEN